MQQTGLLQVGISELYIENRKLKDKLIASNEYFWELAARVQTIIEMKNYYNNEIDSKVNFLLKGYMPNA